MKYKTFQPGQPIYGNLSMETTDSGSVLDLTHVDPTGASGMRAKNIRKNISVNLFKSDKTHAARMAVDSGLSEVVVESDPEGDGNIEGTAFIQATTAAVKSVIVAHLGIGTGQVMDSVDDEGAHTSAQATSTGGGCTMQCDVGYHQAGMMIFRSEPNTLGQLEVTDAVSIETLPDTARLSITAGVVQGGNHADGWSLLQADGTCFMQGTSSEGLPPGEPVVGDLRMGTTLSSSNIALGDVTGDGLVDMTCTRDPLTQESEVVMSAKAGGRSSIMRCSDASCRLVMVDGTMGLDDTGLVLDGTGDGKIGLGVSNPTEVIEHSSGAHLTAGGVWTNASDVALKENFREVDGDDLLDRIDRLPILRWNYRAESDDVTHIGPTAQDFKRLFDVGDNDRSISTVDPSGIALAAIQVLHRENDELREQNLELKNRLDELNRKLDRVLSRQ